MSSESESSEHGVILLEALEVVKVDCEGNCEGSCSPERCYIGSRWVCMLVLTFLCQITKTIYTKRQISSLNWENAAVNQDKAPL